MKKVSLYFFAAIAVLVPVLAFAQAEIPVMDWVSQVIDYVKNLMSGNLGWGLKVSGAIVLIVSSMKVSILNQWIWSKLGALQQWLGPALGLIAGLLTVAAGGDWSQVIPYLAAGMGAKYLHDLLDLVKKIPGIGPAWVNIITVLEATFGGGSAGK